jgi:isoleucyl-tRNA synthetase
VEGLSNWYLRRSRDRFTLAARPEGGAGHGAEGDAARNALYAVLTTLARLCAPFVPFTAEAIWRSLRVDAGTATPESVHLCDWPLPSDAWVAPELAEDMAAVRELASLGLAARAGVGVRVRQPLAAAEVVLADPARARRLAGLSELLRDELNVRELRFSTDASRFVRFRVKPDFRALGKKLGKDMKAAQQALLDMDAAEARARVLAGGLVLELPGGPVVLGPDEVIVEVAPLPGFSAAGSAVAVVALHADLSEDLLEEGLAREVTSKVQAIRKSLGLVYADRVALSVSGGERTVRMMARFGEEVRRDTGAVHVPPGAVQVPLGVAPETAELTVDGESLRVRIARLG